MPSWLKIATWLLVASLATFSFKKPTFFWQNVNLNDLLLAASFACFIVAWFKKQIDVSFNKWILAGFVAAFATQLIGTTISVTVFGVFAPDTLREYARIIAAYIVCLEVYTIAKQNHGFVKTALYALAASSVLLPFMIYAPQSILPFFLDESRTRFMGFLYDPNYYATLQILPAFILLWISFQRTRDRHWTISVTAFLLFSLSVGSIIWSGSRGGVAGLAVAAMVIIGFILWKLPWKTASVYTLLVIVGCTMGYKLMPDHGKQNITARAQTIIVATVPEPIKPNAMTSISTSSTASGSASPIQLSVLKKIMTPLFKLTAQQGRFPIWANAWKKFLDNPFGYGPGYGNVVDIQGSYNDHHRVAHNTALQILLTGGIILMIIVAMGIFVLGNTVLAFRGPLGEIHYLVAALVGIVIASLFLDSLWSRWIWIIVALIAAISHNYSKNSHR